MNPYRDLPAERFWRKAVAGVPPFALDPGPRDAFRIARTDRVATAGSCFAQRVSQALARGGFRYHVTEEAPEGMGEAEATSRQYGTFSARYGNLYGPRQFVQLFDRAFGAFDPQLKAWQREDGRFVDPFRPTIEPDGFADEAAVLAAREHHLARVRDLFESLDVLVVTLGLTEGWRCRADGAALSLAPGVAGGRFDPAEVAFVNATTSEVIGDLSGFLDRLWSVNGRARVIVTVSPVPLIATYLDQHVLVSNAQSKAVLRAAAGEICERGDPRLVYFPSYEIITSQTHGGRYYGEDQRSIAEAGVAHVMRSFMKSFSPGSDSAPAAPPAHASEAEFTGTAGIVCDEETIERSLV
ncbi:GSCFA domain-containing protein [Methylorubrum populi]